MFVRAFDFLDEDFSICERQVSDRVVFLIDTEMVFVVKREIGAMRVDTVIEAGVFKERKEGFVIV